MLTVAYVSLYMHLAFEIPMLFERCGPTQSLDKFWVSLQHGRLLQVLPVVWHCGVVAECFYYPLSVGADLFWAIQSADYMW